MQTAVWYGALMGRRTLVLPSGAWPVEPEQEAAYAAARWPALHDPTAPLEDTVALAREELGFHRVLPPDELRHAVGWDSATKRAVARMVRSAADLRYRRTSVTH